MNAPKHPIQPLVNVDGVTRFKPNQIVRDLLDGVVAPDLNAIARREYSQEDQEQFAQLIGYSLSGYGDLSYVSDVTYEAAVAQGSSTDAAGARIHVLESKLAALREALSEPIAELYGIHPDDLKNGRP